jgi:hypothetical protein
LFDVTYRAEERLLGGDSCGSPSLRRMSLIGVLPPPVDRVVVVNGGSAGDEPLLRTVTEMSGRASNESRRVSVKLPPTDAPLFLLLPPLKLLLRLPCLL